MAGILHQPQPARQVSGTEQLHRNRMAVDGMPFRGPAPNFKEDEYEQRTQVVNDAQVAVFDMSLSADRATLEEILSNAYNGEWQIYKMIETPAPQPDGSVKMYVYCAWVKQFREAIQ